MAFLWWCRFSIGGLLEGRKSANRWHCYNFVTKTSLDWLLEMDLGTDCFLTDLCQLRGGPSNSLGVFSIDNFKVVELFLVIIIVLGLGFSTLTIIQVDEKPHPTCSLLVPKAFQRILDAKQSVQFLLSKLFTNTLNITMVGMGWLMRLWLECGGILFWMKCSLVKKVQAFGIHIIYSV